MSIGFKKLTSITSAVNTFDERQVGLTGGQDNFGYILDATVGAITLRLPKISLCEGKTITFHTVNPSGRNVIVAVPAGSTDKIVINSAEVNQIANTADFGQVSLVCNGTRWFAISDASFS